MIVDTHCHLHFEQFDADRAEVIERARVSGVKYMVIVGTDPETNQKARDLASKYPFMAHTAGLHPHSAHLADGRGGFETRPCIDQIEDFVHAAKPSAIGEVGLDYFKSEAEPAVQKKVFARMIGIAIANDLPVVVHSRNAFDDTYEMLKAEGKGKLRGLMHCYSYDAASLKKVMDLGFLASFACNITYKNAAALLEAAVSVPLDRVVIETDSPYLAPQSHRGQRNEPSHLKALVRFLADKRGVSPEEFAARTSENAIRLFRLPAVP